MARASPYVRRCRASGPRSSRRRARRGNAPMLATFLGIDPAAQGHTLDVERADLFLRAALRLGLHRDHTVHGGGPCTAPGASAFTRTPCGPELHRKRLHQPDDRPFRRGIGAAERVARDPGRGGGQRDQPMPLCPHHARGPAAGQERPVQVHCDAVLPGVVIQRLDQVRRARPYRHWRRRHRRGPTLASTSDRNVSMSASRVTSATRAMAAGWGAREIRDRVHVHVADRHLRPLDEKAFGDGAPDARGAGGDEDAPWSCGGRAFWSGRAFRAPPAAPSLARPCPRPRPRRARPAARLVASTPFSSQRLSSSPTRTCPPASTAAAA